MAFAFLDLKNFSQKLHGTEIPSKWFASIWFFMLPCLLSAHIANIDGLSMHILFGFFCHQNLIWSSSFCMLPESSFANATVCARESLDVPRGEDVAVHNAPAVN